MFWAFLSFAEASESQAFGSRSLPIAIGKGAPTMPQSLTHDFVLKIKYKTAEQKVFALGSFLFVLSFTKISSVRHPLEG